MWLPVASVVTGVEPDSSKPATDGQAPSSSATGDTGQINRDMNSGNDSATASADVSMVTDSGNHFMNSMPSDSNGWFANPMANLTGGFMNSMPPDYSFFPINSMVSNSENQPMNSMAPEAANYSANPMVSESMSQPSNCIASESPVPPSCEEKSSVPPGCEEKLSSVPEIDRDLFWPREFKLYIVNDNLKTNVARAKVVGEFAE